MGQWQRGVSKAVALVQLAERGIYAASTSEVAGVGIFQRVGIFER